MSAASFSESGFTVIPGFLSADDVHELQTSTQEYHRSLRGRHDPEVAVSWEDPDRILQILHAEKLNRPLDRIIRSARAMGLVRPHLGFDVGLHHCKLIMKPPGSAPIPWHQDFSYWVTAQTPCQVNVMVYIDDATPANGCLRVIPGSHRHGLDRHSAASGAFALAIEVDPQQAVELPGTAGTAILFSPLLKHSSGPNRSTAQRRSFTAVYTDPLADPCREVLNSFFPLSDIKCVAGPGPFGPAASPRAYHRRALWKLAAQSVADHAAPWVEVTDSTFEDGSFEWLAARKGSRTKYLRFDVHGTVASNRDDVVVVPGQLLDTLCAVDAPCGLVHIDCQSYESTDTALSLLRPWLRPGAIMIFDRFYNVPDWERQAYRAFQDFVVLARIGFEYLGRAESQVAVRITDQEPCACPIVQWRPGIEGITYG